MKAKSSTVVGTKKDLMGIPELAAFLHVSKVTAWKLKDSGKIPYIKVGKKLMFKSDEVMKCVLNPVKE